MNDTSQFFKKHQFGEHTLLHKKAKTLVKQLPLLRMPINASPGDWPPPVAEEIADDGIDPRHIIELAHLSNDPGISRFVIRHYCTWADCLAAELQFARDITADETHNPFCALYVIRVYAPNWSMPDERVTPVVKKPRKAASARECNLAFEVLQGQFGMIPISLNGAARMLG
ncbi:hypothetical protein WAB97_011590 [Stenotrophomonas maltophilia]|uniref:hypothetical protein n=1 Tax=Stenotrophomonas maltophilia TaxID=40324 RepID=UPI003331DC9A